MSIFTSSLVWESGEIAWCFAFPCESRDFYFGNTKQKQKLFSEHTQMTSSESKVHF